MFKHILVVLPLILFVGCTEDDPSFMSYLMQLKNSTEISIKYCLSLDDKKICDTLEAHDSISFENSIDSLLLGNPCCRSFTLVDYYAENDLLNLEVETKVIFSKYYSDIDFNIEFISAELKNDDSIQ